MLLTPHEQERLMLSCASDLARRRRGRGLRLDHPETVAVISSFLLEGARDGRTVAEPVAAGRGVLTREDVMDGVPEAAQVGDASCSGRDVVDLEVLVQAVSGRLPLRDGLEGQAYEAGRLNV